MVPPKTRSELELKDRHNKWIVRLKSDVDPKQRKLMNDMEDDMEGYNMRGMDPNAFDHKDSDFDDYTTDSDEGSVENKKLKTEKIERKDEQKNDGETKENMDQYASKYQLIPLAAILGKQCHCSPSQGGPSQGGPSQAGPSQVLDPTEECYNKKGSGKRKGVNIQLDSKGMVKICPKSESGAPAGTSVTIDLARPMTNIIQQPKLETTTPNERRTTSLSANSYQSGFRGGPTGHNYAIQGQEGYENQGRPMYEEPSIGQAHGYYNTPPPYYGSLYGHVGRPSFEMSFPNFRTIEIPPGYEGSTPVLGYYYYENLPYFPPPMRRNTPPPLPNYLPGFQIPPHIRQMFDAPILYPPRNPSRRNSH